MYCVRCGSPLPEGQHFCPNCGAPAPETCEAQQSAGNEAGAGPQQGNGPWYGPGTQGAYGPGGQQQPYGAVPAQKKQSTMGIVALILSFFIAPVGLVLAIVDLCRHDETEEHGCAVAGLVISIILTLLFVLIIALGVNIASDLTSDYMSALSLQPLTAAVLCFG